MIFFHLVTEYDIQKQSSPQVLWNPFLVLHRKLINMTEVIYCVCNFFNMMLFIAKQRDTYVERRFVCRHLTNEPHHPEYKEV